MKNGLASRAAQLRAKRFTFMKLFARLIIRLYQMTVSPFLHWLGGPGTGCRFEPSCSQYFLDAVEGHGALRGMRLGLKRICRCNPWCQPGYDPVPPPEQKNPQTQVSH
jgi:putative membrane protein insertion efficiency factor